MDPYSVFFACTCDTCKISVTGEGNMRDRKLIGITNETFGWISDTIVSLFNKIFVEAKNLEKFYEKYQKLLVSTSSGDFQNAHF